jgi:hypothetical protein
MLSPWNPVVIALLTSVISVMDARDVIGLFIRSARGVSNPAVAEKDWSVFFVVNPSLFWPNLVHDVLAYTAQAAAIFMALALVTAFFQHNRFLLLHIYQRRLTKTGAPRIAIELDDKDERFGFVNARWAFDVQVLTLVVAAPIFLVTRYANVSPEVENQLSRLAFTALALVTFKFDPEKNSLDIPYGEMLRDTGQWMAVTGWLVTLGIVSMPLAIKFLPRLRKPRIQREVVKYLQEFLPDGQLRWKVGEQPKEATLKETMNQFARNAFWPDGDEFAWWLFVGAFFVLSWILLPLPMHSASLIGFAALGGIAVGVTTVLFKALRWSLAVIHPGLVKRSQQDKD